MTSTFALQSTYTQRFAFQTPRGRYEHVANETVCFFWGGDGTWTCQNVYNMEQGWFGGYDSKGWKVSGRFFGATRRLRSQREKLSSWRCGRWLWIISSGRFSNWTTQIYDQYILFQRHVSGWTLHVSATYASNMFGSWRCNDWVSKIGN